MRNPHILTCKRRDAGGLTERQENALGMPEQRHHQRRIADRNPQTHAHRPPHAARVALPLCLGGDWQNRLTEAGPEYHHDEEKRRRQNAGRQRLNRIPAKHDGVGGIDQHQPDLRSDQRYAERQRGAQMPAPTRGRRVRAGCRGCHAMVFDAFGHCGAMPDFDIRFHAFRTD